MRAYSAWRNRLSAPGHPNVGQHPPDEISLLRFGFSRRSYHRFLGFRAPDWWGDDDHQRLLDYRWGAHQDLPL